MAFARMNNCRSGCCLPQRCCWSVSFFVPGGATAAGWTMYAPLSTQMGIGMDMAIFALHIMGASSIMGSINIITTILNMRAPGMTLMKMPMFCWTWLITAYLLIAVMPVLAGAITMTLTDRHFGTSFFNAAGGGVKRHQCGSAPAGVPGSRISTVAAHVAMKNRTAVMPFEEAPRGDARNLRREFDLTVDDKHAMIEAKMRLLNVARKLLADGRIPLAGEVTWIG